ncbi:NnrU family protein [Hyphomicrobium methylovorum]|uniref:NnrU family protein n=1 Tax=Hyphomicrobium methylovorum TaxID=84 RepID=UPI0015E6421C|nr:NnrU family protein [Hyphomicrobium methylovorum]MBA2125367.1 NnrU family protein [Hyphomicrobium methylovorum]
MMVLIVGLILFLGIHLLPTSPELRDGLKERLGENVYKILFSLISLAGLVVIVLGFHKLQLHPGKNPILWDPPVWTRHIAVALMFPAMILLVASIIPSRIRTATRHPMLIAIKIWALAHLLANGDLASLLLFGSFLAFAVYDRISVKRRVTATPSSFAQPPGAFNDVIVVVVGVALYAALLFGGHQWLIGVAPIPSLS